MPGYDDASVLKGLCDPACSWDGFWSQRYIRPTGSARCSLPTLYGRTALMFASMFENQEAIDELVKAGANLKVKDGDGRTALEDAKHLHLRVSINALEKAEANIKDNGIKIENTNEKPKGLIRFVFLVVSLPVQPEQTQMAEFLMNLLPEFEQQQDGTAKIGFLCETTSMNLINVQSLAIDAFGNNILDSDKYIYRTISIKLKTGEAKCFVVYDKDVM